MIVERLRDRTAWAELEAHFDRIKDVHLREWFDEDPGRAQRLTCDAADLHLDYSKARIDDESVRLLVALAEQSGLRERIHAMFAGARLNVTENRAVLHVALRAQAGESFELDGHDVVPDVRAVLDRMADFADRIRSGEWTGHTGQPIRNVINIGIGGSDLGPVMAFEALRYYARRDMVFRFVSNVDSTDFVEATRDLEPGRDVVRCVIEDVHHSGDDDQRARGSTVAA